MNCRPNYYCYPGQYQPQNAYLYIYENATLGTEYSAEIGYSIQARIFHRVDMRFRIDCGLTERECAALIELIAPLAFELLGKTRLEWHCCTYCRKFNDDAEALYDEIEFLCANQRTQDFERCNDDTCEFCRDAE